MPHISRTEAQDLNIPETTIQTVLFDKDSYTKKEAKRWLAERAFNGANYRSTTNQHRFWQVPPIDGARFWSQKSDGVTLVFQQY